jgi:hypothetical protein
MDKKKGHPKAAPNHTAYFADLTTEAQRNRMIDALRVAPVTTIEARLNLDILMPAARVHELRHRHGFNILTYWTEQETECGKKHRVACYVLITGGNQHVVG